MIVLDPRWLCGSVCGHLLSQEFLETVKSSGCYTSHDFQLATPDWNSDNLLPVLEALGMCTQVYSLCNDFEVICIKCDETFHEIKNVTFQSFYLIA